MLVKAWPLGTPSCKCIWRSHPQARLQVHMVEVPPSRRPDRFKGRMTGHAVHLIRQRTAQQAAGAARQQSLTARSAASVGVQKREFQFLVISQRRRRSPRNSVLAGRERDDLHGAACHSNGRSQEPLVDAPLPFDEERLDCGSGWRVLMTRCTVTQLSCSSGCNDGNIEDLIQGAMKWEAGGETARECFKRGRSIRVEYRRYS